MDNTINVTWERCYDDDFSHYTLFKSDYDWSTIDTVDIIENSETTLYSLSEDDYEHISNIYNDDIHTRFPYSSS